jgi:hypothetical protein
MNIYRENIRQGLVFHTCDPITGEAEAGGLGVWGQYELYNKTQS